jgi:hypothetical protein
MMKEPQFVPKSYYVTVGAFPLEEVEALIVLLKEWDAHIETIARGALTAKSVDAVEEDA